MSLRLTKDKKIISDYYGESKEVSPMNLLKVAFLEDVTEIDGWTLEDLMDIVNPLKEIWSELAWCDFEAFYKELKSDLPAEKADIDHIDGVDRIKVYRVMELGDDGYITESFHIHGEADGDPNTYAMGYSPLNTMKHLKIVASDDFEVRKMYSVDPPLFKAKKPLCLLEIIWAILWEISFHGTPEDREAFNTELGERIKNIEDGTEEMIPAEEVMERLKARIDGAKETEDAMKELEEGKGVKSDSVEGLLLDLNSDKKDD